jgi:hypothetical protein
MSDTLHASCHCGKVRLRFPASAAGVIACHCGDCQKMHGNFNAFLATPKAEVTLDGDEALIWYQSSADARRAFCGTCGARVLKEVTGAGRWLISAGLVDGPLGRGVVKHLWEASRPDWYDLPPLRG